MQADAREAMNRHIAAAVTAIAVATGLVTGAASGGRPPGQLLPANLTPPAISGTAQVGNSLTADVGTWDGKRLQYAYQWLRCDSSGANCSAIGGATASTLSLLSAYLGARLRVVVVAANRKGSVAATSAATAAVSNATLAPAPAPPTADTTAPTAPGVPEVTGTTQTSISVSWTPSTDNVTVAGYDMYQGATKVASVTGTTYAFGGLACGTTYTLGLAAYDAAGNRSAQSSASAATAACASPPTGTIRDVYAGGSIAAAVSASSAGDTVRLHAGSYPQVTLSKQFITAVQIVAGSGESVTVGGFVIDGGAGYRISGLSLVGQSLVRNAAHDVTFDHVDCTLVAGTTTSSCFYLQDSSHDIVISDSTARGGWDEVKVYAAYPASVSNVTVKDSDLSGATEDNFHIDGVRNMTIEHNRIHDPIDNGDHNDGIQSQRSDQLTITRNTFSFESVPAGQGGPNQGMMIGMQPNDGAITNTVISDNLIAHWNGGRPLILSGSDATTVVNNTFVDSGTGVTDPSITLNAQYASQWGPQFQDTHLEIWNNIVNKIYVDAGATGPSFCDTNLVTNPQSGMSGANVITGDPKFVDNLRYALSPTSPAIGNGLTWSGTPGVDIDGLPRLSPPNLGARG